MSPIRPAVRGDIPAILAVFEAARGIMRADGNRDQWVGGYPSEAILEEDLAQGAGYVRCGEDGRVDGYFAFLPSPEPTYSRIEGGAWLDDRRPYHVIHRIAGTPAGHGLFADMLAFCGAREDNLRIDTHRNNRIMQHLLHKHGFSRCGIIYLTSGAERIAFQRIASAGQAS